MTMNSKKLIENFLRDRLGVMPENLGNYSMLADLGVDSLMLAELMFEAEDKFNISISSDITPPKTVDEMITLIDELVARQNV